MKPDDPERQLAAALGRVPSGIFILTVAHGGRESGMLASWIQQCSFKPPRLSVAVQPSREIVKLLTGDARIVVNILESSQTDVIAHFGKGFALTDDAFHGIEVLREDGRGPILAEALACLEGRLVDRVTVGDHDLLILELNAGRLLGEGQPMIHIRKNGFHY